MGECKRGACFLTARQTCLSLQTVKISIFASSPKICPYGSIFLWNSWLNLKTNASTNFALLQGPSRCYFQEVLIFLQLHRSEPMFLFQTYVCVCRALTFFDFQCRLAICVYWWSEVIQGVVEFFRSNSAGYLTFLKVSLKFVFSLNIDAVTMGLGAKESPGQDLSNGAFGFQLCWLLPPKIRVTISPVWITHRNWKRRWGNAFNCLMCVRGSQMEGKEAGGVGCNVNLWVKSHIWGKSWLFNARRVCCVGKGWQGLG